MKLLVFGQSGQVARALAEIAPDAVFLGRDQVDLGNPGACAEQITETDAEAVINAAAWTAVDAAEDEPDAAMVVNGHAPGAMALAAAERSLPFVHVSTDYVFDGSGTRPWDVDDATGPLGVYGATKLAGERGVRAADGTHAILRTSWVFSATGANFVKTMLRLSETRDALTVVGDQVGGPTPAADIAAACVAIAEQLRADPAKSGTYHFSGAPDVSWADFAREIFRQTGSKVAVTDIATSEYPTPAQRPLNSRLNCATTEAAFGIARPDWRQGLGRVLQRLKDAT